MESGATNLNEALLAALHNEFVTLDVIEYLVNSGATNIDEALVTISSSMSIKNNEDVHRVLPDFGVSVPKLRQQRKSPRLR